MIHHVFANRSNVGDWLSARGIQSVLKAEELTEHLCDEGFVDQTLARLSSADATDCVVIGGGGLFMDYFEPFWKGLLEMADRVPYALWGVGFCDLKLESSLPSMQLIAEVVRKSGLCVLRDELSRTYLAQCKAEPSVPCPSILAIEHSPPGFGVLHVDNYIPVGAAAYDAMTAYGKEFASRTGRPYRSTNNYIDSPGSQAALARTLDLYARSDVILTSRLHGCIIGLAMGRRVVAVSGDRKVESFMQAANLANWVLDAKDVEEVPALLAQLARQGAPDVFLDHARRQNQAVAARVRALAGLD